MFETQVLIENALVLMARKQSKYLYARYKHPKTGVWREKSTKTWDPKKAEEIARAFYYDFEVKVENNIPTVTRTMGKVIDLYLQQLKEEHQRGTRLSDSNYAVKVRVTQKFVHPFFHNKLIHAVDRNMLMEYATWRRGYWKNQPTGTMIEYVRADGRAAHRPIGEKELEADADMRHERAILNSLFRIAATKGWIKEWQVPKVDFKSDVINKGPNKSKVKPDAFFTPQEYHYIKEHMKVWANQPAKFRYRKQAAYYYVMLCFTTGVRPGTAMDSLRWRDIKAVQSGGNDALMQLINGFRIEPVVADKDGKADAMGDVRLDIFVPESKVGPHRSLGLNEAFWLYQNYQTDWGLIAFDLVEAMERRSKQEQVPVNDHYNEEDYLFLLPNGYRLKGEQVSDYFKKFLDDHNMTYSEDAKDKRSLYSARHSFISHMQAQGVPDGLICEVSGTSLEMLRKHYSHQKVSAIGHLFGDYSTERVK